MQSETYPRFVRQFLSHREAAEYLGVREQTLAMWRCLKRQTIPYTRVGRLIKYRPADLDAWLASRTVGGAAAEAV